MKYLKFHIYFLFFLFLIINGCDCGYETQTLPCGYGGGNKTFTFDVYAKWGEDGTPIQVGKLLVKGYGYTYYEEKYYDTGDCEYRIGEYKLDDQSVNFDETGHATITTNEISFGTKYDHVWFTVGPHFPIMLGSDYEINAKHLYLDYSSKQKYTLNIIFRSHVF